MTRLPSLEHRLLFRIQGAAGVQGRQPYLLLGDPPQARPHAERHGDLAEVNSGGKFVAKQPSTGGLVRDVDCLGRAIEISRRLVGLGRQDTDHVEVDAVDRHTLPDRGGHAPI
jgi:hypothetical protein